MRSDPDPELIGWIRAFFAGSGPFMWDPDFLLQNRIQIQFGSKNRIRILFKIDWIRNTDYKDPDLCFLCGSGSRRFLLVRTLWIQIRNTAESRKERHMGSGFKSKTKSGF